MEGSFFDDLRQFEFFGGDQKPVHFSTSSQAPVVNGSTPYSGDHLSQGIYQNEESIDLTSFLEGYSPDTPANTVSSPGSVFSQQVSPHYTPAPTLISSTVSPLQAETVFSFSSSYCPQSSIVSTSGSQTMYGNTGNENCLSVVSNNSTGEPLSASSTVSSTSIPVVQIDPLVGTKHAPGKAKSSKKRSLVRGTDEWRHKRDRNNDAVRKSREKSKKRIQETEYRVKELEEENRQLQSKITLLAKELNVLKSLFTSAGVAQPPLCGVKDEIASHLR